MMPENYSAKLNLPYTAIIGFRCNGGISDETWEDLITSDSEFAAFAKDKDCSPSPDETYGGDPEQFSEGMKSYYERAIAASGITPTDKEK